MERRRDVHQAIRKVKSGQNPKPHRCKRIATGSNRNSITVPKCKTKRYRSIHPFKLGARLPRNFLLIEEKQGSTPTIEGENTSSGVDSLQAPAKK